MSRFHFPSTASVLLLAGLVLATPASAALPGPTAAASVEPANENRGRVNLGTSLTDRGEFESAEIAFRQVLAEPSATPEETKAALLGLARLHRKQGALTKAAAIYEKFLKEYPGDERTPDALLELGRTLRSLGAHRLAIARFYSVINSTLKLPNGGFAHYQQLAKTAQFEIAETHFESGEYAEAAKFFSRLRLLDLAPADRARAHFKAAYALNLQGDHAGAVTMLCSFLEQWPDDDNVPEARYLLTVSLRALQLPQQALAATFDLLRTQQSSMHGDPKRWAYWQRRTGNQLANDFFEHGDVLNALAIYTCLAGLTNDPAWRLPVLYQIALCDERVGSVGQAHAAYEEIVTAAQHSAVPETTELGRMATWRLSQLDWSDGISHQVTHLFESSTGQPPVPQETSATHL